MQRILAIIQILIVLAIIVFGTWQLFLGNFAASMSTMPLLLVYFMFLSLRAKRQQ